jgi:hypothetical protein
MHSSISETKMQDLLHLRPPPSTQADILSCIAKQHQTDDDDDDHDIVLLGYDAMWTYR